MRRVHLLLTLAAVCAWAPQFPSLAAAETSVTPALAPSVPAPPIRFSARVAGGLRDGSAILITERGPLAVAVDADPGLQVQPAIKPATRAGLCATN